MVNNHVVHHARGEEPRAFYKTQAEAKKDMALEVYNRNMPGYGGIKLKVMVMVMTRVMVGVGVGCGYRWINLKENSLYGRD